MIVDLVMYFLRQGEYNGQGDVAVLCAYLGQLQKVRAALRSLKVTVAVDERDEDQLVRQGLQGEDETPSIEEVAVARHVRQLRPAVSSCPDLDGCSQVRLGTVDIFQGQEAKIVIVSLVRNSGEFDTGNASIGFLKVTIKPWCRSDGLSDLVLVGESYQRRPIASQARPLHYGQCFESTEESYVVHDPR